ncbi:MAG: hypothetical protein US63_C0017G0012 [Candidatus Moranbacteria bacterium GW2011_GWC2_37_8]|nr:MAG: hypothetical protein US63_C0017G0012 [Candidatus Moranbacteria bacterium GW2011_GWC2_37_8]KKQ63376.1 MAG: hypothetical protein US82_C0001G0045 [Parcubacteria group bacterium GW2011_GWC1_38_22]
MFEGIFKKAATLESMNYTNVEGKAMNEKMYVAWLNGAKKQLKDKVANEILVKKQQPGFTSEKMQQAGRDAVQSVMTESKHFQNNPNDTVDVKASKEGLRSAVNMIMRECGLSESELFVRANNIEEVIELGEDDIVSEPIVEISEPTYEQIEMQAVGISDSAKQYEEQYLNGVLIPMWEKYEKETDQEMKSRYYSEYLNVQKGYIEIIDEDLSEIGDSDYFEMSAAKGELFNVRKKIAEYGVSMDSTVPTVREAA